MFVFTENLTICPADIEADFLNQIVFDGKYFPMADVNVSYTFNHHKDEYAQLLSVTYEEKDILPILSRRGYDDLAYRCMSDWRD